MLVIGQTEPSRGNELLTLIINSSAYLAESSIRHWRMVARFRSSKCIASTHPMQLLMSRNSIFFTMWALSSPFYLPQCYLLLAVCSRNRCGVIVLPAVSIYCYL